MKLTLPLLVFLVFSASVAQQVKTRIGNQDVIDMVGAGIPDEVIIAKIESAESVNFDTSVAGLKSLGLANVSTSVMKVIVKVQSGKMQVVPDSASSNIANSSSIPSEIGVYLVRDGNLFEIEPEIVGWRQGGVLKHYATLGIDREHVNGKVMRHRSNLQLMCPAEFVIRTAEGTSATEYQLLHLYRKGDRREFRAYTGGVYHASAGAERNAVPFTPEKIASRT